MFGREAMNTDVVHFEVDFSGGGEPSVNKIFDDLRLRVDGDGLSGERLKVDAMAAAIESQLNPVVNQALALHALPDTGCRQQINRVLFQDSGANPFLHVLPAAAF